MLVVWKCTTHSTLCPPDRRECIRYSSPFDFHFDVIPHEGIHDDACVGSDRMMTVWPYDPYDRHGRAEFLCGGLQLLWRSSHPRCETHGVPSPAFRIEVFASAMNHNCYHFHNYVFIIHGELAGVFLLFRGYCMLFLATFQHFNTWMLLVL